MAIWKGISFPFSISPTTGGVETVIADEDRDIFDLYRQSIIQIIATSLEERVIEKNFGTEVDRFYPQVVLGTNVRECTYYNNEQRTIARVA